MKMTKTASGKWTTLICVGTDPSGKRHFKRFTGPDKALVRQTASNYLVEHKNYIESQVFKDSLNRYIERKATVLSPATIRTYKSIQKVLEKDYAAFCQISCDRITADHLQELINAGIDNKDTPKTIRNRIGLILSVLRSEKITPPVGYELPAKAQPKLCNPTENDMKQILAVSQGEKIYLPVLLAIMGLRRSEICGLAVEDLKGNQLYISRAVVYDENQNPVLKGTKTYDSCRVVTVPDELAELISQQNHHVPYLPKLTAVTDMSPSAISESFRYILDKNGLPHIRLHDCRHFFASYCHAKGVPDADIMKAGGWKTDQVMKRVYRYAMDENAVTTTMGNFFSTQK